MYLKRNESDIYISTENDKRWKTFLLKKKLKSSFWVPPQSPSLSVWTCNDRSALLVLNQCAVRTRKKAEIMKEILSNSELAFWADNDNYIF